MTSPSLSIVLDPGDDLTALGLTLASLRDQTSDSWQLLVTGSPHQSAAARAALVSFRVDWLGTRAETLTTSPDVHVAVARNAALRHADGDLVVFLRQGDRLTKRAVHALSRAAAAEPRPDIVYADEATPRLDHKTGATTPAEIVYQPPWSPERLRSQYHWGRMVAYRTTLLRRLGGFDARHDGALEHDLALRAAEDGALPVREPRVLCLREDALHTTRTEHEWAASQRAVEAHLRRTGVDAVVRRGEYPGTLHVLRGLAPDTLVSVIIPTRGTTGRAQDGQRCFVLGAVRSLLGHAGHEHLEIVIVHDVETPPEVLHELQELAGDRLRLVPYGHRFNFSRACNLGVVASFGSVVVLLNDDVEILSSSFLPRLLGPLADPDVGITGAKLLYDDDTVQHAGVAMPESAPWHPFRGWRASEPGPGGMLLTTRECRGVTGACLAVSRSLYDAVGGLTEELPLSYNDVDLCLKVAEAQRRCVWVPHAIAYHYESKSRDPAVTDRDRLVLHRRWALPARDPYFPPTRIAMPRRAATVSAPP